MKILSRVIMVFLSGLYYTACLAQSPSSQNLVLYKLVPAGAEYKTSKSHQKKWGKNYRKDWYTPVTLPIAMLDTLNGGMIPTKAGGGHQTKSLHIKDKNGKSYTLRSVNKTLGKVLPEDFLGTFLEDIVDDKVSMSYPYGAPVAAYLAERANVYHTNPTFYYVPKQPALDTFPNFGDAVYLFEQKLDGNWQEADNLGNFADFDNTYKVIDSLLINNKYRADQKTWIRSRLFDMLINDWDRHEDQWEWGSRQIDGERLYIPVPQDRDQAFFKYDGYILSFLFSASGMSYFQPFDETMRDVKTFNYEQRNLDRFFANEMSLEDWQQTAKNIQQALTDPVIDAAVQQVPDEVKNISTAEIAKKLKGRRDRLVDYATIYYNFLAREVDVPGSKRREQFEVERLNDKETRVSITDADKTQLNNKPLYSRVFNSNVTNEVRLYGIGGNDVYIVKGPANNIKLRLIGGPQKDSMLIEGGGVHVYDNYDNIVQEDGGVKMHLSKKDKVHEFEYDSYTYDKSGIKPTVFYNNDDLLYVGLGYSILKHKWRQKPFAYRHNLSLNFSISQGAFSVTYDGLIPNTIGKWDLVLSGKWDAIRWTNFFGLGNETRFVEDRIYFYRARSEQWLGSLGLTRKFGKVRIGMNAFYQSVRVLADEDRFTGKYLANVIPNLTSVKHFGGAEFLYNMHSLNDSIVPTSGYMFWGRAAYLQNLKDNQRTVGDFQANLRLFLPLGPRFSMILSGGAQTITGTPEFYQNAFIGGGQTFRSLRQGRYWGKTAYYNNNTLRYMADVKGHLYNGKLGLLTFFDNGRVWLDNDHSDVIHTGYGGGILLAPFNKIYGEVTYGVSDDQSKLIQLRLFIPIK